MEIPRRVASTENSGDVISRAGGLELKFWAGRATPWFVGWRIGLMLGRLRGRLSWRGVLLDALNHTWGSSVDFSERVTECMALCSTVLTWVAKSRSHPPAHCPNVYGLVSNFKGHELYGAASFGAGRALGRRRRASRGRPGWRRDGAR